MIGDGGDVLVDLWFIADTHFGHHNILKFTKDDGTLLRPGFSTIEEMDDLIVERWNKRVKDGDHVYHLGDVAMRQPELSTLVRVKGKLRLVRGNHDIFKTKYYLKYFEEIHGVRVISNMVFSHYPLHPMSLGPFKANVHGHTHAHSVDPVVVMNKKTQAITEIPYINVCVEATDYYPVHLDEIVKRVSTRERDIGGY